jgi:hypothetical protein
MNDMTATTNETDDFPARTRAIEALEARGVTVTGLMHASSYWTIDHGHGGICCCLTRGCRSAQCAVNAEIIRTMREEPSPR